jgi:hypothetical protein
VPYAIVTRDTLLQLAEWDAVGEVKRALKRTAEALDAVHPSKRVETTTPDGVTVREEFGGAPDYGTRLRAASMVFDVADVRPTPTNIHADIHGPVTITWQPPSPSSSSSPSLTSGRSMNDSDGSPSSSVTEDSGKPSWL